MAELQNDGTHRIARWEADLSESTKESVITDERLYYSEHRHVWEAPFGSITVGLERVLREIQGRGRVQTFRGTDVAALKATIRHAMY